MGFTPLPSFVGGLLLSYSTSTLLATQGRILGCSGVSHATVAGLLLPESPTNDRKQAWKWATTAGLVVGGMVLRVVRPQLETWIGASIFDAPIAIQQLGWVRILAAGFLVGAGTKLANGCTSGHMLIGLARKSKRSLVAVLTFFTSALLTSTVLFPSPLLSLYSAASKLPFPLPDTYDAAPPIVALLILVAPVLSSLPSVSYSLPLPAHLKPVVQSFFLGLTFTIGLALAGMTRPTKVLSFFFLPGLAPAPAPAWDPSLAMVALGGLVPNFFVWNKVLARWKRPIENDKWECPPVATGRIDAKLVLGSAMFGIGWGLMGICPGPMLALLGAGPAIAGSAFFAFASAYAFGGLVARPF
ncbi:hypothetical protein JCM8115_001375 [Rhodotorula mucilaginosa]|uniref:Sulphur transport domain-containing protein n=1 Tax=Rhodotorula mucilaginosa TaxID=5537 RepID=A0A9P6W153_RHOMI|nr:hypothetical protein C6P46_005085 [Rhodotorula mucilaginosa]TKA53861.1 hypothetical protein B0A53_03651 [Rhodotorula sp. CCFEE 5036]